MSETLEETPAAGPNPTPPARRRWQFGVRDAVLLVVVVALAASIRVNRRRADELAPRIAQLRPIVRELDVADPRQFAAIPRPPDFTGDLAWDVHVPDGSEFRLCIATRGIGERGVAPPARSVPIAPGRHRLTLAMWEDFGPTRFIVHDGAERRLAVDESGGWAVALGNPLRPLDATSIQGPADLPFVLLRRFRFAPAPPARATIVTVPPVTGEGLLIWVEPAGGPAGAGSR